ncbi:MAG: DUF4249 family protein [Pricia sp.]|nr:DUF4249 family protein [Pricia sp.]
MKKLLSLILVLISLTSCEDVIEVDVPSDEPRLMVDALMRIDTTDSSSSYVAEVKVGLTSDFFGSISPVQLQQITITNTSLSESIELLESQSNSGVYRQDTSIDFMTSGDLILEIMYNDVRFRATTAYVPAEPIDKLEQGEATLFSGEETEIIVAFTDNPNRDDFYLFDFDFSQYLVTEDEFYQGQTFEFSYFYDEGLESGRIIDVSIIGVDEGFYNYMNQIIVQAGGDQGPFQTPAATVRGNIIRVKSTNSRDDFAMGYFAVCQTFSEMITIE